MKQILAMARKDFFLWAQKPGSWIIVFLVPLLFVWFMYTVFGERGTPIVTIYAVNTDAGRAGEQVMEALYQADNLRIEELETREEADERIGAGERMAAVIIPEEFSEAVRQPAGAQIEIMIDPARSEQANLVIGLVNAALGPVIVDAEVSRGVEAGIDQVLSNLENPTGQPDTTETPLPLGSGSDAPFPILEETPFNPLLDPGTPTAEGADDPFASGFQTEETPTPGSPGSFPGGESQLGEEPSPNSPERKFLTAALKGVVSSQVEEALENPQVELDVQAYGGQDEHRPSLLDYLVPGYSLMFVFFLVASMATTVVQERETGALRRLLVAPVPRSRILLGKMLPYFLIAVAQFAFVLVVSRLAFGIDLGRSPTALAIIIITSALSMTSLGILIASFARTYAQADGLAIVIILAMAVISGAMFPSIFIPGLQNITPHYWAMHGFLNVINRGMGIQGVLLPAGILLSMSAVFFTIGAVRFQFE